MADNLNLTVERFRRALADYSMVSASDRVLVAVSGGQDSVALLHMLSELPPGSHQGLVAAYFHHGLRNAADDEEAFVAALAERLACRFVRGEADVGARVAEDGLNLEVAARAARYDFLHAEADRHGCERIALGHTGSDLAESVLMNIVRGAGVDGLAGIPPVNGPLVRPLVYVSRAETATYCKAHDLPYRTDESNYDTDGFTRNRIRHRLLPALEADYGPGVEQALLRAALAAREEIDWTEPLVADALTRCVLDIDDQQRSVSIDVATASGLPRGLLVRVIRAACARAVLPVRELGWEHCRGMANIIYAEAGSAEISLPGDLCARRVYSRLDIGPNVAAERCEPFSVPLSVPGKTHLPGGRSVIVTEHTGKPSRFPAAHSEDAVLDAVAAGDELGARTIREGDRFVPLGMSGTKLVSDLLIDEKVPAQERPGVVCVVDGQDNILWLAGLRLSQRAAITPKTTAYYSVRVTPQGREP
jgi:tRNA(Ile)-lysidine synthase